MCTSAMPIDPAFNGRSSFGPAPPSPTPWIWQCHKCHHVYRFSAALNRCLHCSHRYCKKCVSQFDYDGWVDWKSYWVRVHEEIEMQEAELQIIHEHQGGIGESFMRNPSWNESQLDITGGDTQMDTERGVDQYDGSQLIDCWFTQEPGYCEYLDRRTDAKEPEEPDPEEYYTYSTPNALWNVEPSSGSLEELDHPHHNVSPSNTNRSVFAEISNNNGNRVHTTTTTTVEIPFILDHRRNSIVEDQENDSPLLDRDILHSPCSPTFPPFIEYINTNNHRPISPTFVDYMYSPPNSPDFPSTPPPPSPYDCAASSPAFASAFYLDNINHSYETPLPASISGAMQPNVQTSSVDWREEVDIVSVGLDEELALTTEKWAGVGFKRGAKNYGHGKSGRFERQKSAKRRITK